MSCGSFQGGCGSFIRPTPSRVNYSGGCAIMSSCGGGYKPPQEQMINISITIPKEQTVNISNDPCFPNFVLKTSNQGIAYLKELNEKREQYLVLKSQNNSSKRQVLNSIAKGNDGVCFGMSPNADKFMCYLFKEQKVSAIPVAAMDLLMSKGAKFIGLDYDKRAKQILLRLVDSLPVVNILKRDLGVPLKYNHNTPDETKSISIKDDYDDYDRD